ncbi:MAG TPA: TM2 domain-containing protein [Coriobacteriia bacterium]|nr:TM2 domain-containing protein [Coriobacteriia bacterium]
MDDEITQGAPEAADVPAAEDVTVPEPAGFEPPVAPEPEPVPEPPAAPEFEVPAPPPPPPAPAAPVAPPAPAAAPSASASPFGGGEKNKMVAGILAILLGSLGIHKFYLGYNKEGIILIAVTIVGSFLFGLGPMVASVIGLIEGVMYLTKTDADFEATYVTGQKPWF